MSANLLVYATIIRIYNCVHILSKDYDVIVNIRWLFVDCVG